MVIHHYYTQSEWCISSVLQKQKELLSNLLPVWDGEGNAAPFVALGGGAE